MFLDESGLLMAPLVRRTWSKRGQSPVLYHRTRHHQKVSIVAALAIAPTRNRVHCYFRLHAGTNVTGARITTFLRQLHRHVHAPVIIIWDRFQAHRSMQVQALLANLPTMYTVFLPPYAPELNPMEHGWGYLKTNPLSNLVVTDVEELAATTRHHGRVLQRREALLRSFLAHSPLSLRLT